jgi:hypothetical protein
LGEGGDCVLGWSEHENQDFLHVLRAIFSRHFVESHRLYLAKPFDSLGVCKCAELDLCSGGHVKPSLIVVSAIEIFVS